MTEHNSKDPKSHILMHSKEKKHRRVFMPNLMIVGSGYKSDFRTKISEALYIKELKPDLNKLKDAYRSSYSTRNDVKYLTFNAIASFNIDSSPMHVKTQFDDRWRWSSIKISNSIKMINKLLAIQFLTKELLSNGAENP